MSNDPYRPANQIAQSMPSGPTKPVRLRSVTAAIGRLTAVLHFGAAPETGRLRVLDGVRAVSILLILIVHLMPLGPPWLGLAPITGNGGMSLFFGLSGFLIATILWETPDAVRFLVRRTARILPLLLFYGALVSLVFNWRPDTFLAILTLTLNYSDEQLFSEVSHLWSLCIELHFYIIMGLAVALFGRRGFWIVPMLAVAVTAMRVDSGISVSIRTHLRADEILSGALLGLYWSNRDCLGWQWVERLAKGALPLTFSLWLLSCQGAVFSLAYGRPYLTMLLLGGLLTLPKCSTLATMLSAPTFGYVARISYALYIWHPLFAAGGMSSGATAIKYGVKRPITLLATFVFSVLSTKYLEAPFIRMAKGIRGRGSG